MVDLEPCDGWTGGRPNIESEFAGAAAAEKYGRLCANAKLAVARDVIKSGK
jgi:hypothetical protein